MGVGRRQIWRKKYLATARKNSKSVWNAKYCSCTTEATKPRMWLLQVLYGQYDWAIFTLCVRLMIFFFDKELITIMFYITFYWHLDDAYFLSQAISYCAKIYCKNFDNFHGMGWRKNIYKYLAIFLSETIDKGENKHTDSQAVKNIIRTEKRWNICQRMRRNRKS